MTLKHHFFLKFLTPGRIILILVLVYIALLTVPYLRHKEVSEEFKNHFKERDFYSQTTGAERIAYINDNTDALLYRLNMIEQAQEEIILSTFDFNADKGGKDIMAALLHAADRGVKVRVIVDGFSGFLDVQWKGNDWFQALASHENISLRIYNPLSPLKPWKIQARLHDKYLIIDRQMFLLGGRNTTNLFLGNYSKAKNIDREIFVYETQDQKDSSLYQLRSYFEQIWDLKDSKDFIFKKLTDDVQECLASLEKRYDKLTKTYKEAYTDWDYQSLTFETNKISLLCNPLKANNKEPWMWYSIHQLLKDGQKALIYTPYIICGKEMYQDLTELKQENIPVEIITNDVASGANPWGCTDYLNQKKRIWNTGAKVYEFMGGHSCHTKAVLIDDRMSIVGSYNLDMRSTYQDTELMLAIDSKELNAMIQKEAQRDKTYSKTMGSDGAYIQGENYVPKELSFGKKVFYLILRVLTVPIRRFL